MGNSMEADQFELKKSNLARQIMKLAFDQILVNLRFFDVALSRLNMKERPLLGEIGNDGATIYYDPGYIIKEYKKEQTYVSRVCLHSLLHCIFHHAYEATNKDPILWNLASDMAVENIIIGMGISGFALHDDERIRARLQFYGKEAGGLTAEKLYAYFKRNPMSDEMISEFYRDFAKDVHYWEKTEELMITEEDWKKVSERIRQELKAFSGDAGGDEELLKNIEESNRTKYDYKGFLEKFMSIGEDLCINDDEFDYVYYTYGLSLYENMPLVEPLEFKDHKKIKEFVIVLDTSASCRGNVLRSFLQKTYEIMKTGESFFSKVNIHILQCDMQVQSDTLITCDEDFDEFMKNAKLSGFGGTDFRPAFGYVESLIEKGEFENLRGMIYFTDGYGQFPNHKPGFETAFVFVSEQDNQPPLPYWAIKLVLRPDEITEEN